jgi:predicted HTH domain antitoxin
MTEKINIKLPIDLLKLSGLSFEGLEEKSLLIWILELYSEGKITVSKASNLLNMKVDDFLAEFQERHLKHIGGPTSIQDAQNDMETIQKLTTDQQ